MNQHKPKQIKVGNGAGKCLRAMVSFYRRERYCPSALDLVKESELIGATFNNASANISALRHLLEELPDGTGGIGVGTIVHSPDDFKVNRFHFQVWEPEAFFRILNQVIGYGNYSYCWWKLFEITKPAEVACAERRSPCRKTSTGGVTR